MARMPSIEAVYDEAVRAQLLNIAWDSIDSGLATGRPQLPALDDLAASMRELRASFVTLHLNQQLRGCIGLLEARYPLATDVAQNAFSAAFRDPRFGPLTPGERDDLTLHIAVLSPAEPIAFTDETDLLAKLRPGIDGLILEDAGYRGTFLPAVWESLPEANDFWRQLKRKAGLPVDYWSGTITVRRYTTESFP